jgi:hypothetical protein
LLTHPRDVVRTAALVYVENVQSLEDRIRVPEAELDLLLTEPVYQNQALLATFSSMLDQEQGARLRAALEVVAEHEDAFANSLYGSLRSRLDIAERLALGESSASGSIR